jgi:hypothetical protein
MFCLVLNPNVACTHTQHHAQWVGPSVAQFSVWRLNTPATFRVNHGNTTTCHNASEMLATARTSPFTAHRYVACSLCKTIMPSAIATPYLIQSCATHCTSREYTPQPSLLKSRILTCTSTRRSPRKRCGSVGQCDETLKHFNLHLASHP